MSDAKYKVIGEVIKQTSPFKAVKIYQPLMLSSSLVQYHLSQLINEGFLEKDRQFYCLVDRSGLIDHLTNLGENKVSGLLERDIGWLKTDYSKVNERVNDAILLKHAGAPGIQEVIKVYVNNIDEGIRALQGLKRHLNSKSMSEDKAKKKVLENIYGQNEVFWERYGDLFMAAGIDKKTHKDWLEKLDSEVV